MRAAAAYELNRRECEAELRSFPRRRESRAISAFTRVHSPSKTGVNALNDALWGWVPAFAGTSGRECLKTKRSLHSSGTRGMVDHAAKTHMEGTAGAARAAHLALRP